MREGVVGVELDDAQPHLDGLVVALETHQGHGLAVQGLRPVGVEGERLVVLDEGGVVLVLAEEGEPLQVERLTRFFVGVGHGEGIVGQAGPAHKPHIAGSMPRAAKPFSSKFARNMSRSFSAAAS